MDQPQEGSGAHEGAGQVQAHAAAPLPVRARAAVLQAAGRGPVRPGGALLQLQVLPQSEKPLRRLSVPVT